MSEAFYALAVLACPVGMGLMMWFMMRGAQHPRGAAQQPSGDAEVVALRAELDQLQAELRQSQRGSSAPGSDEPR